MVNWILSISSNPGTLISEIINVLLIIFFFIFLIKIKILLNLKIP